MKRALAAGSVAVLLALAGVAQAAPTAPSGAGPALLMPGAAPPELHAQRIVGSDAVSLASLRGRVVVLDFWATWCGPCRMIMPELDHLSTQYHAQGLSVIGVTQDDESDVRHHLARAAVGYTIAQDVGSTFRDYGVRAIPMLVVVDRHGNVSRIFSGVSSGDMADLDALVRRLLAQSP
jgi:thiol-disulfide isomerase/thioredoxin